MAEVHAYTTVAALRTWMSDEGSILPQTLLEGAVNSASRAIDEYCGRRFWKDVSPTTRQYKVKDSDVAWINDVSDRDSVVIKTDDTGDYQWLNTWEASDYDLEPYNGSELDKPHAYWRVIAVGGMGFPVNSLRRTLQVTALFGWSDIPDGVSQACIIKANNLVKRKDAPFGVAGFTEFGAVRISRSEDPDVAGLLNPFVRAYAGAI